MEETQSALRFNRSLWLLCRNRWGQGEEQEGLRGDGEIIQVGRDRGLAGAGAAKAVRSSLIHLFILQIALEAVFGQALTVLNTLNIHSPYLLA